MNSPREREGETTTGPSTYPCRILDLTVDMIVPESSSHGPLPNVGVTGDGSNAVPNASDRISLPALLSLALPAVCPKASTERLNFSANGVSMLDILVWSSWTELHQPSVTTTKQNKTIDKPVLRNPVINDCPCTLRQSIRLDTPSNHVHSLGSTRVGFVPCTPGHHVLQFLECAVARCRLFDKLANYGCHIGIMLGPTLERFVVRA